MLSTNIRSVIKTYELNKIVNITDEEFNKLDYKGKQKYYAAKSKLSKTFWDKGTYKKPKKRVDSK